MRITSLQHISVDTVCFRNPWLYPENLTVANHEFQQVTCHHLRMLEHCRVLPCSLASQSIHTTFSKLVVSKVIGDPKKGLFSTINRNPYVVLVDYLGVPL